jgi:transcriptional regulator with XRE-family HTH domain
VADPLHVFAENVRAMRKAAGLSQEALGERAGLEMAYVGRIERAEKDPSVRTVARLARGLDVAVADLFDGVPQADDNTPRRRAPG